MQGSITVSDKAIIQLIDQEATREVGFRKLLELYQEPVYWQIRRMVEEHEDAKDLAQDVWLTIYKKLDSFKGNSALYTWIYRIAINASINFLKKEKGRRLGEEQLKNFASSIQDSDINGQEVWDVLQRSVILLPVKQQLVFNMRYFDEMSYEEISQKVGTSVGALKASYHLAVKKIEAYVRKEV